MCNKAIAIDLRTRFWNQTYMNHNAQGLKQGEELPKNKSKKKKYKHLKLIII